MSVAIGDRMFVCPDWDPTGATGGIARGYEGQIVDLLRDTQSALVAADGGGQRLVKWVNLYRLDEPIYEIAGMGYMSFADVRRAHPDDEDWFMVLTIARLEIGQATVVPAVGGAVHLTRIR